jgi:phage baseplate assembly protein W
MAIKIKNLEQLSNDYTIKKYVYKDLSLDIGLTKIESPGFNLPIPGADIKASFDISAIANSLTNLFNTLPGQRFLFPEYGLDLYQFLFEPITDFNAEILGRRILDGIKKFESRVNPLQIKVKPNPDENTYYVTAVLKIPILNTTTETMFLLDTKRQTFLFLPAAKNN